MTFESLGLSGENLKYIVDKTNIVFHLAATLKLEGNLKDAIDMNLSGTRRTLNLAKQMKNLEAFVHVSTAFCNCDQEVMYEKIYEFPHRPEDLMRLAEWMDVKTLDAITPDLLRPHPNTYTYSKRLAELLVRDHYDRLPVIVARPSIGKCLCPRTFHTHTKIYETNGGKYLQTQSSDDEQKIKKIRNFWPALVFLYATIS